MWVGVGGWQGVGGGGGMAGRGGVYMKHLVCCQFSRISRHTDDVL